MTILPSQRHLFDVPNDVAYFNCAYNAPMLNASSEVLIEGVQSKQHPWERTPASFFDDADAIRTTAAQTLGGSADCFAVIPSASYGISAAARILEDHVTSEDEIIVLEEAFPSNYLPWHRLSEVTGARIVTVPTPDDFDWTKAVLHYTSKKTAVIAVPNCHWTNGARLDLELISEEARSAGAALVLDVTQSLGAMPLNFKVIKPDFCVAAGYKWLLFPYGISLFYADPRWHDSRPLEETWLGREGAENFADLVNYSHTYQSGARRFDMGQKCIANLTPGAVLSLQQLGDWGVENIAETLKDTNRLIAGALSNTPLVPLPEAFSSPHILGLTADGGLPESLLPNLASEKIYASRRGSALRFAPHLHVSENDIDRLGSTISKVFSH